MNVITINKNNKEGLGKTIESVLSQTCFNDIKYIIIDGGSTDGSKQVIEQIKDKLYYWCSELDRGIFHAFNKGIEHCVDDYTIFLNSGDFFHSNDVIEKAIPQLEDKDIVYGNEYKCKGNADPYRWCGKMNHEWYTKYLSLDGKLSKYPDKLHEGFFRIAALPHQSTFIKTSLLKKYKFSEDYKILGDWMFFREAIMVNGASYKHINLPISVYNLDGISTRLQHIFKQERSDYYENLSLHTVL